MREVPIIFSGDSIRAILEGRKTQTRRLIKPQPPEGLEKEFPIIRITNGGIYFLEQRDGDMFPTLGRYFKIRWQVGDLLWVKEVWGVGTRPCPYSGWVDGIEYRADEAYLADGDLLPLYQVNLPDDVCRSDYRTGWKSPIFMPKWATRIKLEVTDVRVQRVQDITEEDAIAEGIDGAMCREYTTKSPCSGELLPVSIHAYASLWDSINPQYPWSSNPWVGALTFRRVSR